MFNNKNHADTQTSITYIIYILENLFNTGMYLTMYHSHVVNNIEAYIISLERI